MNRAENGTTATIVIYLTILVIVVVSLLSYFEYRNSQNKIAEQFISKRNYVAEGSLKNIREKVESEHSYLFLDCAERSDYELLIDADSRKLNATELKRALLLHEECGNYFVNKSKLILYLFKNDLEYLNDYAELFGTGEKARNALVVARYWQDIYDKERERVIISDRFLDIQESYWINDLNKSLGIITPEEREASVGALNYEANQKLSEIEIIIDEIAELRRIENLFWSESFEAPPSNK